MKTDTEITYPETYLHVRHCQSGEEWIIPITGRMNLDLETRVRHWIKREFCGELKLDGKIMSRLEGDYYAQVKTDGSTPDSVMCWDSGGFYLDTTY